MRILARLLTKHMYLCGARIPFVLFGENFIQWPWFQLRYVSQLSCANSLICLTDIKSFQVLYSYPSFYHHYLSLDIHKAYIKASSSIHMISKSDSSLSTFCSTSACWRLVYGAMQCNGNVPSQGNGATKADATNRCRLTRNKQTITTKQQVVLPRLML